MAFQILQDWSRQGAWGPWMNPVYFAELWGERHGVAFVDLWHWSHSSLIFLWTLHSLINLQREVSPFLFLKTQIMVLGEKKKRERFLKFSLIQWVSKKPTCFLCQVLEVWSLFTSEELLAVLATVTELDVWDESVSSAAAGAARWFRRTSQELWILEVCQLTVAQYIFCMCVCVNTHMHAGICMQVENTEIKPYSFRDMSTRWEMKIMVFEYFVKILS